MAHLGCRVKISRITVMTGEVGGGESFQVAVEPGQGALDYIASVLGI
jgi:hypothetical protein